MAGKRHHFIPKFLQKGFASHDIEGEFFTWVYRKGSEPFNTNIKNVGVEQYFYSIDGDTSLDDEITKVEQKYSFILEQLRHGAPIESVSPELLAQLFAHMEIRTRHLRQSFHAAGAHLVDEILKFFEDTNMAEQYFRKKLAPDQPLLRNVISSQLEQQGISQEHLPYIIHESSPLMDQVMPQVLKAVQQNVNQLRSRIPSMMAQAAKVGHIRGLAHNLEVDFKAQRYKRLRYELVNEQTVSIPLGDSPVLFNVEGTRAFKTFLEERDVLKAVLLPLTPQDVLIGFNVDCQIDINELPFEIAQCSLEYFISKENSKSTSFNRAYIGRNSHLISMEEIEAILDEIIGF